MTETDMNKSYTVAGKLLRIKAEENPALAEQLRQLEQMRPIVVPGQHDHVNLIFSSMGIDFETIDLSKLHKQPLAPGRPLIINCGTQVVPTKAVSVIQNHVQFGSPLITTDWALHYVLEKVFPGYIAWTGQQTEALDECFPIDVANGEDRPSWFVERLSYPLNILKPDLVTVLLKSTEFGAKYRCNPALGVSFPVEKGAVIHYVSHLYAQMTAIKNQQDAQAGSTFAQTLGLDEAVAGQMGQETSFAGVSSSYSSLRSVVDSCTATIAFRPESSALGKEQVHPQDQLNVVIDVKNQGKVFLSITPDHQLKIGRATSNDIKVEDTLVSRVHAYFTPVGDKILVQDASSTNGTYLNGKRLVVPTPLHYQDKVGVGGSSIGINRAA